MPEDPKYRGLLEKYISSFSPEIVMWLREDYERNEMNPHELKHSVNAGHKVRSKSEKLIANILYDRQIPYRYEALLQLDDNKTFPDFTILHPKTFRIGYYEHFGIVDDPQYVRKTAWKIEQYANHGIVMNVNLLATFETADHPLDEMQVYTVLRLWGL